jgi:hypothetical protein
VLSRLERGAFSKATLETIKKVADALDVRLGSNWSIKR